MVFCIAGIALFAVLGLFSAKYRAYAKEAWRCFSRQITLRPCDTGFDKKMRASATGRIMKFSPRLARFVYRYFSVFSWILVILTLVSVYSVATTAYNIAIYGTCDPQAAMCLLTGA